MKTTLTTILVVFLAIYLYQVQSNQITFENFSDKVDKCYLKDNKIEKLFCSKDLLIGSINLLTKDAPTHVKLKSYVYLLNLFEVFDQIVYQKKINMSFTIFPIDYKQINDMILAEKYLDFLFIEVFPHIENIFNTSDEVLDFDLFPIFSK